MVHSDLLNWTSALLCQRKEMEQLVGINLPREQDIRSSLAISLMLSAGLQEGWFYHPEGVITERMNTYKGRKMGRDQR